MREWVGHLERHMAKRSARIALFNTYMLYGTAEHMKLHTQNRNDKWELGSIITDYVSTTYFTWV